MMSAKITIKRKSSHDQETQRAQRTLQYLPKHRDTVQDAAGDGLLELATNSMLTSCFVQLDSRVQVGVGNVGQQVGQHEKDGHDQHARTYDGVVAGLDGVENQRAHTGTAEDNLDENRAAHQVADADAQDCHGRDERVLECVLVNGSADCASPAALAARM